MLIATGPDWRPTVHHNYSSRNTVGLPTPFNLDSDQELKSEREGRFHFGNYSLCPQQILLLFNYNRIYFQLEIVQWFALDMLQRQLFLQPRYSQRWQRRGAIIANFNDIVMKTARQIVFLAASHSSQRPSPEQKAIIFMSPSEGLPPMNTKKAQRSQCSKMVATEVKPSSQMVGWLQVEA